MIETGSLASAYAPRVVPAAATNRRGPQEGVFVAPRAQDKVEVSQLAQMLSKLRSMPAVRQDLIDRVRQEIAGGAYDTPEKLDAALGEMLKDVAE